MIPVASLKQACVLIWPVGVSPGMLWKGRFSFPWGGWAGGVGAWSCWQKSNAKAETSQTPRIPALTGGHQGPAMPGRTAKLSYHEPANPAFCFSCFELNLSFAKKKRNFDFVLFRVPEAPRGPGPWSLFVCHDTPSK